MAQHFILLVLCCVLPLQIMAGRNTGGSPNRNANTVSPLQAIAETNAEFSKEFFKAISGTEGNLVASPLSAHLVLALAHLGAGGQTKTEMTKGLCLPEDITVIQDGFNSLISTLKSSEKVELEIANRMYVKSGFALSPAFTAAALSTFNSTVQSVEFTAPRTRADINDWVEKTTQDKIKDLIPDGVLDALTRLVLVNAVYFKGPWLSPFNPTNTRNRPFYTDETNSVQTPFMYQKAYYGYANLESLNAELLEMPYKGGKLSLVILLPKSKTGLPDLERAMQTQDLSELLRSTDNRELELYLPKFKLESSLNLNEPLKQMGMRLMYSDAADFSGISTAEHLQVSDVLQKAFIEISEEGTEAAAATVAQVNYLSAFEYEYQKFNVEQPFMFYIVAKLNSDRDFDFELMRGDEFSREDDYGGGRRGSDGRRRPNMGRRRRQMKRPVLFRGRFVTPTMRAN